MKKCNCEWCERTEENWNGRFNKYDNEWYCAKHYMQLKKYEKNIKNTIVQEKGINDMPYGWRKENEWNEMVYRKWSSCLQRVYSENFHNKDKSYINSTLQLEMHWLSYFAEHIKEIDGYDEKKLLNGELVLDKDIKSNGKNNEYSIENCMFVSVSENSKQANKNRNYTSITGENSVVSKKVGMYDENNNLIKIFSTLTEASYSTSININCISRCCRGKQKITKDKNGNKFYWKIIERE